METIQNPAFIGVMFILVGLLGLVPFARLAQVFDYPDILRQPTGDILRKYHAGGISLTLTWFAFAVFAFPLVVLAVLLQDAFAGLDVDQTYLAVMTIFGVVGAVFNLVGLMRWVFLVPLLARKYVDPETSPAVRGAVEIVFEGFHTYLGVTIGEFLGFGFLGVWGIMLGIAFLQTDIVSPLFGIAAILFAGGIIVGDFEFAGWKPAGIVAAISSSLFLILMIVLGVLFIIG
jgi:hypothetical protein